MQFPDFTLTGKTAIITGASRGIGSCVALAMAHAGADIMLVSRNIANNHDLEEDIRAMGRKVQSFSCDVSDLEQIQAMVQAALDAFGQIDILVNNAGVAFPQFALDVTPEKWDMTHSINLRGLFFCCQTVGRQMIEKGLKGKIINMASTFSVVGYPKRSAYGAAKGGIAQLTKVLALEWAQYGICVNTLSPTAIKTDMIDALMKDPVAYQDLLSRIPMGRLGESEDIAGAAVFLASPAANFITGHNLLVDGGWTAQ